MPFKSNTSPEQTKRTNHNKSTGTNFESKDTDDYKDLCIVTMKQD